MKEKVIGFWKKNYAFLIAFFIIGGYHIFMGVDGDSVFFSRQLEEMTFREFIAFRYQAWSSRLLIEAGLLFFTNHLFWWRIADTVIWVLMLWSMTKFLDWEYTPRFAGIVCMLFFCYGIQPMGSAGWIATINNYMWPCACLCGFLLVLKKLFQEGELKWHLGISGIILIVLAGNQEQAAAALFGIFFLCLIYLIWKKRKIPVWFWAYGIAILLNLLYIITCPGNENRKLLETGTWFPVFSELGLWQKLDIGITSIFHDCIFGDNSLFLIFLAVLCMAVQGTQADNWKKYIVFLPLIGTIAVRYRLDFIASFVPGAVNLRDSLKETGTFELGKEWSIAALFFYAGIGLCILWGLFLIFRNNEKDGLIAASILGIGFGTRMMMGFSPTVWASGSRTMLFWQMALVLASAYLWNRNLGDREQGEMQVLILIFAAMTISGGRG
ncbi:MAG: hypothetical protein HFH49_12720 [Lachnospiraceae bacterium]|nr:hypothetical protein [Lachnospiraceae bacterium]